MDSLDAVISRFPEEIRSKYDFSSAKYTGALNRIEHCVCPEHGEFSQYAAQLRKGHGCPHCGSKKRIATRTMSQGQFILGCQKVHEGKGYDFSNTKYTNMSTRVRVGCPQHGEFGIIARNLYYRGQGCPQCAMVKKHEHIRKHRHLASPSKIANTGLTFFDRCREAHDSFYEYPPQEYTGAKNNIRVICPKHGEFVQAAQKHLSGAGCPSCGQKSSQESVIKAFIEGLGIKVESRKRNIIPPFEIDLWLPEHNLAIEYHGLYWHTTDRVGMRHREKWQVSVENGIRLIQIFEDEWFYNKEIVMSRIRAMTGCSQKIHARETTIKQIPSTEAKEFLINHHTQGGGTTGIAYGLYNEGKLVAVATFGRERTGGMTNASTNGWEVYRYASEGVVVGGFGKLLKKFITMYNPSRIISYCDLRYGDGRLYKNTGFTLHSVTEADYWWVMPGARKRVPRYQTQKHKLSTHPELGAYYDPLKTESEICESAGWKKIHGVGNQKWVMLLT